MDNVLVVGVSEILNKLIPVMAEQISQAWGFKNDLRKLGNTLQSIQALIPDAEEEQINQHAVGLWLTRLKDVIYDADDVMDELRYETMLRHGRVSQGKHRSSNPLVRKFKMAVKIRSINRKLDDLAQDKVSYMLRIVANQPSAASLNGIRELRNRLTSSYVDASRVIGRDDAVSDIIKMLTNKSLPSVSSSSSSADNSSYQEKLVRKNEF